MQAVRIALSAAALQAAARKIFKEIAYHSLGEAKSHLALRHFPETRAQPHHVGTTRLLVHTQLLKQFVMDFRRAPSLPAHQIHDGFDVIGVRKHVHRLRLAHCVAAFDEHRRIPR